jgi:hypothetical protein
LAIGSILPSLVSLYFLLCNYPLHNTIAWLRSTEKHVMRRLLFVYFHFITLN